MRGLDFAYLFFKPLEGRGSLTSTDTASLGSSFKSPPKVDVGMTYSLNKKSKPSAGIEPTEDKHGSAHNWAVFIN